MMKMRDSDWLTALFATAHRGLANGGERMGLRLLVVEGNNAAAREDHRASYGKTPSQAYADVLEALAGDARCDICYPADEGANVPDAGGLEGYDGVALTGSSFHIYETSAAVAAQISLARAVFAARIPFFGSCWGLQVASVAAGGGVIRNPKGREAGIARNIAPTEAGRRHLLLTGRPAAFDAPCAHFDIVAQLPPDSVILAQNGMAAVQAAEVRFEGGVFWGVQYHPEHDLAEMAAIIARGWQAMVAGGLAPDRAAVDAHVRDLRRLHDDRSRRDLAWRLGVQPDVFDDHLRLTELRNWMEHYVRPEKSRRLRA